MLVLLQMQSTITNVPYRERQLCLVFGILPLQELMITFLISSIYIGKQTKILNAQTNKRKREDITNRKDKVNKQQKRVEYSQNPDNKHQ